MANVCAYQFVLRPRQGQSSPDCLDAIRDEIADWVCEIYRAVGHSGVAIPFDGTSTPPHPAHELWSDQRECATHRLAMLEWAWPDGDDPTLRWTLCCTAACDDTSVQVSLLIQIVSQPFVLRPLHYVLKENNPLSYIPGLATRLLRLWPAEIDGWPIPMEVRTLRASALDVFVRETLLNDARVLPVIVINLAGPVNIRGDGLQGAQNRLLGLAQVAALANAPATQRLAQLLPNDPPWEDCPLRVYWPCSSYDPPGVQSLFSPQEMAHELQNRALDQVLLAKFLDFSAVRYREGNLIRAARLAVDRERAGWRRAANTAENEAANARSEARQAREERESLRQECDTARQVIRTLQTDLAALRDATPEPAPRSDSFDELAAELERAWDDNRRLTAALEADQKQLTELQAELRAHQENWTLFASSRAAEGRAPAPAKTEERTFVTVADALHAAGEDFADVLMVWPDATRSAALSPFRMPGKVYRALEAIAEVGRDYFQAKDGGPPLGPVERAFACRVPFKYTGFESQTTLHLYGAERLFHHGEQSRQMQRHLTLGGGDTNNCLQIYFDFDDASRRVLIGYCGRHLPYHRQRT